MCEVAVEFLFEDLGQRFTVFGVEHLCQYRKTLTEYAGERIPIYVLEVLRTS